MTKIEVMQSQDSDKAKVDMAFDKLMTYIKECTQEEIESALDELKDKYTDNTDKHTPDVRVTKQSPFMPSFMPVQNMMVNSIEDNIEEACNECECECENSDDEYDSVNHPAYYVGNIEVIDFIEDKNLGYHLGNAVKYISRAGKKHEEGMSDKDKMIEDLRKAVWYINRKIEILENM